MKQPLAIFDFCGTLVPMQTANLFVDFISQQQTTSYQEFIDSLFQITYHGKAIPPSLRQRLKLLKLRGLSDTDLYQHSRDFVNQILLPQAFTKVEQKVNYYKSKKFIIVILSAAYSTYLQLYAESLQIKNVIATEIQIKDSKVTGFLHTPICKGHQKLTRLNQTFPPTQYDYQNSVTFTDDRQADRFVLQSVGNRFLVNNNSISKMSPITL